MQEQHGHLEGRVEDEAEGLLVLLGGGDGELPLRVVSDRHVFGANGLDERVVRGNAGIRVGRNEAGYDGEAQLGIGGRRGDLGEGGGSSDALSLS